MAEEETSPNASNSEPANGSDTPSEPNESAPETPTQPPAEETSAPVEEKKVEETPASAPVESSPRSEKSSNVIKDLLTKARAKIQFRKRAKLEKIQQLLTTKHKVSNDDVEKLLHVSDATATRYLSELEREGKVRKVGKTGRAVFYERV